MTNYRYGAMQLRLYDRCGTCGALMFDAVTGIPNPPHPACDKAFDRWVDRADNVASNYPVYTGSWAATR